MSVPKSSKIVDNIIRGKAFCMLKEYLNRRHGQYKMFEWIRFGGTIAFVTSTMIGISLCAGGLQIPDQSVHFVQCVVLCLLLSFTVGPELICIYAASDTDTSPPRFCGLNSSQICIAFASLALGAFVSIAFVPEKMTIGHASARLVVGLAIFCVGLAISRYPQLKAQQARIKRRNFD
ncbi:MAG: hypothetical protein K2Z81_00695 [Cyanobacteria bacterium]|nr:hypothetical protein [Cyanobacteriota bacterium]